jgi:hypothetical protein
MLLLPVQNGDSSPLLVATKHAERSDIELDIGIQLTFHSTRLYTEGVRVDTLTQRAFRKTFIWWGVEATPSHRRVFMATDLYTEGVCGDRPLHGGPDRLRTIPSARPRSPAGAYGSVAKLEVLPGLHGLACMVTCCLACMVTCCLACLVTCCLACLVTCCLACLVTCCLACLVTCCLACRVTCCLACLVTCCLACLVMCFCLHGLHGRNCL